MLKRRIIFYSVLSLIIGFASSLLFVSVFRESTPLENPPAPRTEPPERAKSIDAFPLEASAVGCKDLYSLVCGDRRLLEDPTGGVDTDLKGEVEALRIYETIIHKNRGWTLQQVDDELVAKIYTERRRKRLQEVFGWVLKAMKEFVEEQPETRLSKRTKKVLKARLESTKLELPPPASVYASEPELFTKNDVYYASFAGGRRAIRVGGAYVLTARSRFNRIFTFAHELAHSIDPCEVSSFMLTRSMSPYLTLTACFREQGVLRVPATIPSCSLENPAIEIFADWVASEITARAIEEMKPKFKEPAELLKALVNSVRDLCIQDPSESEIRSHPAANERIEAIFGSNPRVRKLLGCEAVAPRHAHCSFGGK